MLFKSIADLQAELDVAKTETASKLIQLHELVSTSGVDVEKIDSQAAQIVKVQETLAALESKLNEVLSVDEPEPSNDEASNDESSNDEVDSNESESEANVE